MRYSILAMRDQRHPLQRRSARQLFPGPAVLEIEPAEVLCRRSVVIFVGGAGVAAVHVKPVAQNGPAEAVDRLGKKGEGRRCSSRPSGALGPRGDGERRIVADLAVWLAVDLAGRSFRST